MDASRLTEEQKQAVVRVGAAMEQLGNEIAAAEQLGLSTLECMSLIAQAQGEELPPMLQMML